MPEDRAADQRDRSLADRSDTSRRPAREAAKRLVGSQALLDRIAPGTLPMTSGQPAVPLPALARPVLRLIDGVGGIAADRPGAARTDTGQVLSRCRVLLRPLP